MALEKTLLEDDNSERKLGGFCEDECCIDKDCGPCQLELALGHQGPTGCVSPTQHAAAIEYLELLEYAQDYVVSGDIEDVTDAVSQLLAIIAVAKPCLYYRVSWTECILTLVATCTGFPQSGFAIRHQRRRRGP